MNFGSNPNVFARPSEVIFDHGALLSALDATGAAEREADVLSQRRTAVVTAAAAEGAARTAKGWAKPSAPSASATFAVDTWKQQLGSGQFESAMRRSNKKKGGGKKSSRKASAKRRNAIEKGSAHADKMKHRHASAASGKRNGRLQRARQAK